MNERTKHCALEEPYSDSLILENNMSISSDLPDPTDPAVVKQSQALLQALSGIAPSTLGHCSKLNIDTDDDQILGCTRSS